MSTGSGLVVVGVDGSPAARAALEFALDEGLVHGAAVEVVTAWLWSSPFEGMEHVGTLVEGHDVVAAVQDAAVRAVLDGRTERPTVSRSVVHDEAGHALVARAEGCRMLVVGSSRKRPLTRAVLGSVSEYCVRHAGAPVVVVTRPDDPGPGRGPAEVEEVLA